MTGDNTTRGVSLSDDGEEDEVIYEVGVVPSSSAVMLISPLTAPRQVLASPRHHNTPERVNPGALPHRYWPDKKRK